MPRSESECEEWHNSHESHCRCEPWIPSGLLAERLRCGGRRFTANTGSPKEGGIPTEERGSEGGQHDADQPIARRRYPPRLLSHQPTASGFLSYIAHPLIWSHTTLGYFIRHPSSQTLIPQLPQTRQNPVPIKPHSPTQTMHHHYTPPPALRMHSTPAIERAESVASGGLS